MEGGQSSGNIELREARSRSPARRNDRGKTPVMEAPLIGSGKERSSYDQARHVERQAAGAVGMKRGVSVLDFVLRLVALAAALAATITMGTTDQTLPFFTQFFQFQAEYDDLPSFTYFVVANAVSSAYLVLSLPFSVVTIVRPLVKGPRLLLITLDAVVLALTVSAAGAATAIVYVAHKGNVNANWIAICQQFDSFCERTSGAVVASFIAAVLFAILVILSAIALKG